ncbi:hypothetical protein DU508_00115 [Pedobacter chinensis]|uniref:Uncharacterized protein n=1 Tax=Pedobacter chinensis TaxID=2282421 RepID=A0A369Q589_9SPHI|nr:hypothetical protein DU508_00115 [Pedobacter chinensis]
MTIVQVWCLNVTLNHGQSVLERVSNTESIREWEEGPNGKQYQILNPSFVRGINNGLLFYQNL